MACINYWCRVCDNYQWERLDACDICGACDWGREFDEELRHDPRDDRPDKEPEDGR